MGNISLNGNDFSTDENTVGEDSMNMWEDEKQYFCAYFTLYFNFFHFFSAMTTHGEGADLKLQGPPCSFLGLAKALQSDPM